MLFVSQPTVTGVAQCIYDWTTGLRGKGWEVELACPSEGWLPEACRDAGIPRHEWQASNEPHRGLPTEIQTLRAIVQRSAPDVVYLHGAKAGLVGRMALRGRLPTAFSPHSWSFHASEGPLGTAAAQWERFAARWTTGFICVSEAEAAEGINEGIHGLYTVARNGIDTSAITPAATSTRQALRRHFGIGDDEICVVCVGRIHRQKGQDVLLKAWPRVRMDKARLVIVGDGPDMHNSQLHATSDVRFVGEVDRQTAVQWMQAADLLVMPSRWEGMALVPLESLAVGTPVIASDVSGAREAIDDTCGAVVAPGDRAALAGAIREWIDRVRHEGHVYRQAARQRVTSSFDVGDTVATLNSTLRSMLPLVVDLREGQHRAAARRAPGRSS